MEKGSYINVLRDFDIEQDFAEFASRWDEGICPPVASLPKNGVVVGDGDLMGFLAMTDCDFTIITWYQFGKVSSVAKHRAFNDYIEWCKQVAKNNGKKFCFCFSNKSGIIRILESHKFHQIDKGHYALEVF
jgi:hypothetical protein